MARPSKLTPDTHKRIVETLTAGTTIEKACDYVGIGTSTFYDWMRLGRNAKTGKYSEFSDAVTHAQSATHIRATVALRGAMTETESRTTITDVITETRLRKIKRQDGTVEEVPYEYRKETRRNSVTISPPDWRAAVEFLKRRDNQSWSDKTTITLDDWRMRLLEDIRKGTVNLETVIREFGSEQDFVNAIDEPSLAAQLFAAAGVQLQDSES